jgi:beta-N-acetylhexosaminidase
MRVTAAPAKQPQTVPKPRIVWDPIPFGAKRKAEMKAYAERHSGIDSYKLVHPHVIVIHYTVTPSYEATFNTFAPDLPDPELHELPNTCAHYVVDQYGVIHQLVSINIMCRHTVGLNWTAIGIEHVGYSDAQVLDDRKQMAASLALVRWLRCRFQIEIKNVIGHNESLSSPYHRERVASLRRELTRSDVAVKDADPADRIKPQARVELLGPAVVVGFDEHELVAGLVRQGDCARDQAPGAASIAPRRRRVDVLDLRGDAVGVELGHGHQLTGLVTDPEVRRRSRAGLTRGGVDDLVQRRGSHLGVVGDPLAHQLRHSVPVNLADAVGAGFAVGRPHEHHQHVAVKRPSVGDQRLLEPERAVLVLDHELAIRKVAEMLLGELDGPRI